MSQGLTIQVMLIVLTLALHCAAPSAAAAKDNADFLRNFKCPEALPDDAARKKAVEDFFAWALPQRKDWTEQQLNDLRIALLRRNQCKQTLANMGIALELDADPRYACVAANGQRRFSSKGGEGCKGVPIASTWVSFYKSPTVLIDILPTSLVREPDGVKAWTQFYLASPAEGDRGGWKYDDVKAVTKYFCKTRQMLLIQGTYSLNGKRVWERSVKDSFMEEIEPGTLAEKLLLHLCRQ